MSHISRTGLNEECAHNGVVEAGGFVFISYLMKNEGQPIENQINGAFDVLNKRLESVGLTMESIVKMDCLFKDISDLSFLTDIVKARFHGHYPARKAYETAFIREGIAFQLDAIAYRANQPYKISPPIRQRHHQ